MTRWPPRTLWSAPRIASRPAPWRSSSCWASPPTSATPRSRCSVLVYSSFSRRASSWARSMTRLARASRCSWPPWIRARRARIAAISPRNAPRSVPRRRSVSAGMPSSGSTSAASRCSASRTGLCIRSADCWAARMASWAFSVKRSSCMVQGLVAGAVVGGIRWWPGGRAGRRGRGTPSPRPSPRRAGGSAGRP